MIGDIYIYLRRWIRQNFCKHEYYETAGREMTSGGIQVMPQIRCKKCDRKVW